MLAVCGTGPDNVWAAGENGTILHWDGSTWAQQTTPTVTRLNTVFVLDAEQVWVGGNDGVLLRLVPDTGEWESVALSTDENIAAIWASASDNVWLAAYDEVWHFDGELWHRNREDLFRGISALWGNSTGNIWTVTRLGGRIRRKTP